jgi:ABC-type transport system involved in multi-copper enzyme maturation permease subunit
VKKPILRALFLDAYYQVLDNMVFRILAVVVCLIVLPAFLVGFRPEGIVLFWGIKTIGYQEFASWFGQHLPSDSKDVHLAFIRGAQEVVVGGLAGNVGIFFSLAATAFFVPRMLEKGAADVVFSRPVGRATLLCARYFAGVLFVALLGSVLVLGMHLGLLLVSGASDPAFLWSILTLTYVFALVHGVSTFVAVFSRSSVAAILTALLFFTVNGCVHKSWIPLEWARARSALEREEASASGADPKVDLDAGALGFFAGALDTMHFALPKTTDADVIVSKLRTLVSGRTEILRDPQGSLVVRRPPDAYVLAGQGETRDLSAAPAVWSWSAAKEGDCTLTLRRESRIVPGDKPKRRSTGSAARELLASLKQRPDVSGAESHPLPGQRISSELVQWSEGASAQPSARACAFFSSGDWMYLLEIEGGAAETRARELLENVVIERDDPRYMDPESWYARRLDWNAPLRHNIFFSVASSLAFALALFGLAAWKLKRIDF